MRTKWSRLAGDTGVFAIRLTFIDDPESAIPERREDWFSWGALEIWVEGQNLCAHLEEEETVESVHWYMLPMLEWFAASWNPLFHEERLPNKNSQFYAWDSLRDTQRPPGQLTDDDIDDWLSEWQRWWRRHSLTAARTGGLFPDLVFRRWRHLVEVSWGTARNPGTPDHYRFLNAEGHVRLTPHEVAHPIFDVLTDAIRYLLHQNPTSDRLLGLDAQFRALDGEQDLPRLSWLAGLGRDSEEVLNSWSSLNDTLRLRTPPAKQPAFDRAFLGTNGSRLVMEGSCQAALMFGSVSPTIDHNDAMTLGRLLLEQFRAEEQSPSLDQYRMDTPLGTHSWRAWDEGYGLAEIAIQALGLDCDTGPIELERHLDSLDVEVDDITLSDASIRAVAIVGPNHSPAVFVNTAHEMNELPSGRRFILAHELCHLLHDRAHGQTLALASGPWAPRDLEKRANAFAAMFLMPRKLLRDTIARLPEPLESVSGVLSVADTLGTSFTACLEHLTNLGYLDEDQRDSIRVRSDMAISGDRSDS